MCSYADLNTPVLRPWGHINRPGGYLQDHARELGWNHISRVASSNRANTLDMTRYHQGRRITQS